MEGHAVQRDPKLPAVHPVHEGENQDPAYEETQEDDEPIDPVQPGAIQAQLTGTGPEKEQVRYQCSFKHYVQLSKS